MLMVTTKELNYELRAQKSNLKILITSFEKINATLEEVEDFSGQDKLYSFLEGLQDSITQTQDNINFIKEFISKNVKSDTNKSELKEMNKKYNEMLRASAHSFNKFLLEYISSSSYNLEESVVDSIAVDDTILEQDSVTDQIKEDIETCIQKVNSDNQTVSQSQNEQIAETVINQENPYCEYEDNVLLISEKQCKVVLPYNVKELNSILNIDNSYATIQDIIEERYTIPISFYKNPFVSRFKETYNLMKYKEQAPLLKCLQTAVQVSKHKNLNPAIITACNSYEQLEQYLNYLQNNETDKFNCFNIKYEAMPVV